MTHSEILQELAWVQAAWPQVKLPPETAGVWYELLAEESREDVHEALRALLVDGREFPPTAGHVLHRLCPPATEITTMEQARRLEQRVAKQREERRAFWDEIERRRAAGELPEQTS